MNLSFYMDKKPDMENRKGILVSAYPLYYKMQSY